MISSIVRTRLNSDSLRVSAVIHVECLERRGAADEAGQQQA